MKKKILGWLLIVIAVLNLSWDIVIAIDTYNSSPIVDKELIKNRLSGYKFVPRLENLSPQKREEWERKQIIAGKIDSHTSYRNVEILYDNQIFIDMFGIDLFEQYSYDQRKAIIEDSINRYNKDYIDKIFYECLSPYTNDGKLNLFNAKFELDERPIEEGCGCPACQRYSRAYIRHLFVAEEMLAMRLCVMHNLYFYNKLMERIRNALDEGRFEEFRREYSAKLARRI